jgi:signal transduction histidine kinase
MEGQRRGWDRLDAWVRERPVVPDTALAVVLTAVVLPTSARIILGASWPSGGRATVLCLMVLAHAAVALRRVRTVPAFAFVAVVMLVLVLVPDVDGAAAVASGGPLPAILLPTALVFPILLYAVAAHAQPPWPVAALALGLVGALVTTVRLWSPQDWAVPGSFQGYGLRLFIAGALLASVLAPWALGRFRRVRSAYVAALEERAARAEDDRRREAAQAAADERGRIAREMHDVVAHSLSVIVSQAEGGRLAAGKDPAVAVPVLQTVSDTGREALTEMRGLLGLLRRDEEDASGGAAPRDPQPSLASLPSMVERVRGSGTPVVFRQEGHAGELGHQGELTAYRVVQEALTNVVKHAGVDARVEVTLAWGPDLLVIEVVDDGVGMAPGASGGRGLGGMRERLGLLGGGLETGPAAPRGHRLRATIPLSTPPSREVTHD